MPKHDLVKAVHVNWDTTFSVKKMTKFIGPKSLTDEIRQTWEEYLKLFFSNLTLEKGTFDRTHQCNIENINYFQTYVDMTYWNRW